MAQRDANRIGFARFVLPGNYVIFIILYAVCDEDGRGRFLELCVLIQLILRNLPLCGEVGRHGMHGFGTPDRHGTLFVVAFGVKATEIRPVGEWRIRILGQPILFKFRLLFRCPTVRLSEGRPECMHRAVYEQGGYAMRPGLLDHIVRQVGIGVVCEANIVDHYVVVYGVFGSLHEGEGFFEVLGLIRYVHVGKIRDVFDEFVLLCLVVVVLPGEVGDVEHLYGGGGIRAKAGKDHAEGE